MFGKPRFIVSFILDNQPQSRKLEHDSETLAPFEAEALVKQNFPELKDAFMTDVQVQKITKPDESDNVPGHYQQP
ncbi:hypothetical protein [Pseudomonas shahriarae]|jgi:hypothetical protein|uniref:hypothetical protein n=1 Tax=Pseudomonas shahriarae TaxID=2745512 RepID=UPI00235FF1D2|nr:hypothetical protein [Pseudomonas shahriarae]MDD0981215.1 hypothetical protein [Pseudomonas shahriarae]